jgi:hypothetical protein
MAVRPDMGVSCEEGNRSGLTRKPPDQRVLTVSQQAFASGVAGRLSRASHSGNGTAE